MKRVESEVTITAVLADRGGGGGGGGGWTAIPTRTKRIPTVFISYSILSLIEAFLSPKIL
jgi:hypothetical protein